MEKHGEPGLFFLHGWNQHGVTPIPGLFSFDVVIGMQYVSSSVQFCMYEVFPCGVWGGNTSSHVITQTLPCLCVFLLHRNGLSMSSQDTGWVDVIDLVQLTSKLVIYLQSNCILNKAHFMSGWQDVIAENACSCMAVFQVCSRSLLSST